ncbi:hypothetical protein B4U80_03558, partial [Leptotrombidium deliense]
MANLATFKNCIVQQKDDREYLRLTLSNGLHVLLISDPATEKCAAALDVNVGSMSDPKSLQGLASLLEHLLLHGMKKFPCECDNNYMEQHDVYFNSYTSGERTNFHFEVNPSEFSEALERFVKFLMTPLFTENCIEKELNRVHSKYEKNLKNDAWRITQINRVTADPQHDYSNFRTGNKETLKVIPESCGINVKQSLLDFHSQWYSANIMSLAVLGKGSLNELAQLVVTQFKHIENKGVVIPRWSHPLQAPQLRKIVKIVPTIDIRKLNITFPIPDLKKYHKSQLYLTHLIGHKAEGSLLSHLKSLNLCTSLAAEICSFSGFGFFDISVDLTKSGISQPNKVVEVIFGYLQLLKTKRAPKWIFEELKNLNAIKFEFVHKQNSIKTVHQASYTMQHFPIEDVMTANILLGEFRLEIVDELLKMFTPKNCKVTIVGKIFEKEADQCEKWYGIKYTVADMDDLFLQQLENVKIPETVHLPSPNAFIPSNFELVAREDKFHTLTLLKNSETCRIWFRQDNIFPKASFCIIFTSAFVDEDPLCLTAVALFTSLLNDFLGEVAYDAQLAGFSYKCSSEPFGVKLSIFGFNDKLNTLVLKIIQRMSAFGAEKNQFEIFKEMHFRGLRNMAITDTGYGNLLQSQTYGVIEELLKEEIKLTYDKFNDLMKLFFSKLNLKIFAFGNLTSKE